MERYVKRGFCRFRALCVLSDSTIHAVDDMLSLRKLPGVEMLMFSPYIPTKNDGINYVFLGKTAMNGLFGSSLESSGFDSVKLKSEGSSGQYSISDSMLRKGHNCVSWAIEVVNRIPGIEFKTSLVGQLLVVSGTLELTEGQNRAAAAAFAF